MGCAGFSVDWEVGSVSLASRGSARLVRIMGESAQGGKHTTELGAAQLLYFTERISLPGLLCRLRQIASPDLGSVGNLG